MRVLVMGGTQFVGRHIVEDLLSNGHEVTLFHRGKTNPDLFPDCSHLHGDRRVDLSPLEGERWDACIDCCGYIPREVRSLLEKLDTGRYLFISTISVYADFSEPGLTEDAPLADIEDPETEIVDKDTYGGLKALCEDEAKLFDGPWTIVRPGLVCGPHDHTARFTHWATLGEGDPVPQRLGQPVQLIDARDLAKFVVKCIEEGIEGTYNATGESMTFREMLLDCGHEEPFENRTEDEDLPLVLPADGSMDGVFQIDTFKAWEKGLACRELSESAEDVREWASAAKA